MTHRRQSIRAAIVERLTDTVNATVIASRIHNWQPGELPGIAVYTLNEPVEVVTQSRQQQRTLTVAVEIYARAGSDVDDALDGLCVDAERAMETDWTFGGLALRSDLSLTSIGLVGEGDSRHAIARLEYQCMYRVAPGAPDA